MKAKYVAGSETENAVSYLIANIQNDFMDRPDGRTLSIRVQLRIY